MSKVKALYHIVFCTKGRQMVLPLSHIEDLYRMIWYEIKNQNCRLIRIGGIQNHVHMLIDLNPTMALSNLMRIIKSRSSHWLHHDQRFYLFSEWASEYFACTISTKELNTVNEYIRNQVVHHHGRPLDDELNEMYRFANLTFDNRDMI